MQPGTVLAIACALALLVVPRAWAVCVFLFGALICPMGAGVSLGAIDFPPGRLLATVGLLRLFFRREFPVLARTDWAAITFGAAMIWSGLFHEDPSQALVLRCGYALDTVGSYFVFRGLVRSWPDIYRCYITLLVLLIPVAIEMALEAKTGKNLFSELGSLQSESVVRQDRIRAQGPFRHAVNAGTAAAALLPITVGLFRKNRALSIVGMGTLSLAVVACASSGPVLTTGAAVVGMVLWHYRHRIRTIRWALVGTLCVLHLIMSDPVWFLIGKLNVVGGSAGWHRSKLIDAAITHLGEWWWAGTDYTRHWMSGHGYNEANIDITNYYIRCGVNGGLPLLCAFIWLLKRCFGEIRSGVNASLPHDPVQAFFCWCMGAWLFAYVVSMIGINPYDQSLVLFYAIVGVIGALGQIARRESETSPEVGNTSI